jgi:hypothetical protein
VSDISRKADMVVVAARYDPADGRLLRAQAYERRGAVWTDLVLLDRDELLARLRSRRRVYSGAVEPGIPGNFSVRGRLRLQEANGRAVLALETSPTGNDELGVPIF